MPLVVEISVAFSVLVAFIVIGVFLFRIRERFDTVDLEAMQEYRGGRPKAIVQTGEIADGWLPAFFNPHDAGDLLAGLDEGLERSGRTRDAIDIAPLVPVAVEEKIEDAHDAVKPFIAFYLGGMGAKGKNFYVDLCEKYGFGEEANEIQDRFLAGDRMGAVNAVSEDIIEIGSIAVTPDELEPRLGAFGEAGADSLVAMVFGGSRAETIERLAGLGS
jgi:alkanesulfonate monooxygenase SsuD/methylene tetrahydromethanopterin reductase-like flavin-dependent oxidoreductase (luciferase family)